MNTIIIPEQEFEIKIMSNFTTIKYQPHGETTGIFLENNEFVDVRLECRPFTIHCFKADSTDPTKMVFTTGRSVTARLTYEQHTDAVNKSLIVVKLSSINTSIGIYTRTNIMFPYITTPFNGCTLLHAIDRIILHDVYSRTTMMTIKSNLEAHCILVAADNSNLNPGFQYTNHHMIYTGNQNPGSFNAFNYSNQYPPANHYNNNNNIYQRPPFQYGNNLHNRPQYVPYYKYVWQTMSYVDSKVGKTTTTPKLIDEEQHNKSSDNVLTVIEPATLHHPTIHDKIAIPTDNKQPDNLTDKDPTVTEPITLHHSTIHNNVGSLHVREQLNG